MANSPQPASPSASTDAEMAGFMAWRMRFEHAVEAIDLALVPTTWREHVRVYQSAWQRARNAADVDPRGTARAAVRLWLEGSSGIA